MGFFKKADSRESKLDKGIIYFSDPQIQKSFEKFCEAAKKAPLEDQVRLIRKAIRD